MVKRGKIRGVLVFCSRSSPIANPPAAPRFLVHFSQLVLALLPVPSAMTLIILLFCPVGFLASFSSHTPADCIPSQSLPATANSSRPLTLSPWPRLSPYTLCHGVYKNNSIFQHMPPLGPKPSVILVPPQYVPNQAPEDLQDDSGITPMGIFLKVDS